jgi:hypothetical protein
VFPLLTMVSNPYLVIRRIVDKGRTWGAVLKYQGNKFRVTYQELIDIIQSNKKPVYVDFPGADIPVTLTTVSVNGKPALRTIHDNVTKNNFNKIRAVKLVTCSKYRYLIKR